MDADRADTLLRAGVLGEDTTATLAEVAERLDAAAETLAALEREGLVERDGDGGYRSARIDAAELRELYPAALILEAVAVKRAPPYDAAAIAELRAANARFRATRDAAAAADDDDAHAA